MKDQIRLLIGLARADGVVDSKERTLIESIAQANEISIDELESLFSEDSYEIDLAETDENERVDYLVNLVQLMKIDGHTYNSELSYCQEIAIRLGYKKEVIMELYKLIYTDPNIRVPGSMIQETAGKFKN